MRLCRIPFMVREPHHVGHANGHFDFHLVRQAIGDGLSPDVISTDLHGRMGPDNPVGEMSVNQRIAVLWTIRHGQVFSGKG